MNARCHLIPFIMLLETGMERENTQLMTYKTSNKKQLTSDDLVRITETF